MYLAFLSVALLVGGLLAVQASVNLKLTKAVGTPYGAATLQLAIAAGVLVVLASATGAIAAVAQLPGVPGWQLLGGLASPLYITSGILLIPRLGALATVALFVTGQMFASLGLDLFGLLAVPDRPLTIGIALGAVAVLAGITVIIRGQRQAAPALVATDGIANGPPGTAGSITSPVGVVPAPARVAVRVGATGWLLLGILAGAGLPVQGAVNAQLREGLRAPLAVALISFAVATLAIAATLVVLVRLRATPRPRLRPTARMPWWGWLGAVCAVGYVTVTFMLIPMIGAATTVALTVTGQQLGSAAIDSRGMFELPRRVLTPHRLAGLALLVTGSILIQLT